MVELEQGRQKSSPSRGSAWEVAEAEADRQHRLGEGEAGEGALWMVLHRGQALVAEGEGEQHGGWRRAEEEGEQHGGWRRVEGEGEEHDGWRRVEGEGEEHDGWRRAEGELVASSAAAVEARLTQGLSEAEAEEGLQAQNQSREAAAEEEQGHDLELAVAHATVAPRKLVARQTGDSGSRVRWASWLVFSEAAEVQGPGQREPVLIFPRGQTCQRLPAAVEH